VIEAKQKILLLDNDIVETKRAKKEASNNIINNNNINNNMSNNSNNAINININAPPMSSTAMIPTEQMFINSNSNPTIIS